jgi:cation transport regulator ChaB
MRKEDRVPYEMITQLPDGVKNDLSRYAREIYKETFNSAAAGCSVAAFTC